MNKKTLWIIAVIVILIGTGVYFVLNQQGSSPPQTIANFKECARAGYPVESYPRQCWTPDGKTFHEEIGEEPVSPLGPITVSGKITCLPKKGSGPQTKECAIGIKGDDGKHYGLKNLFEYDKEYKFSRTGMRVEVSGTLNREEIKGPNGSTYDVAGVIEVVSIREI